MSNHRRQDVQLPGWLWFFLVLPLGLLVAMLYRQKRLPRLVRRLETLPLRLSIPRRYTEPDSIPLDIRPEAPPAAATETKPAYPPAEIDRITGQIIIEQPGIVPPSAPDDLTVIEGIGPKIAGLLREAGILSFAQLAAAPIEQLGAILTGARLRHLANPGTWSEQASLAAAGDWDALLKLQNTLKGGRRLNRA